MNQSVYIEQQNYSLEINRKHIKPQALNELEVKSSGQLLQPSFHSAILVNGSLLTEKKNYWCGDHSS